VDTEADAKLGDWCRLHCPFKCVAPNAATPEAIDGQVALRMERQAILAQPTRLTCGSCSVRASYGSKSAARPSCALSFAASSTSPSAPASPCKSCRSPHVQPISPFTILDFPDQADPTVVYLEHLTGSLFLESPDEVRRYTVVLDHLRAEALGTGPSVDLIAQLAAGLA
jgi:hypothetical protein